MKPPSRASDIKMKKTKIKFNGNETRKLMEARFTLEKKQNLLLTITKYQFVDEVIT